MLENNPQYHVIEKENEVIFYIPYDEELLNLYTTDFFQLHNQNADVAIIAFHNNDDVLIGGYVDHEDESKILIPYNVFRQKAKYVDDELNKRFNNVMKKESSYDLFSNLLENTKKRFLERVPELENNDNQEIVEEDKNTRDLQTDDLLTTYNDTLIDNNLATDSMKEISPGNIFQITIQKKPVMSDDKQKLKIPLDVILEKEINYYHEKLPNREIKEKYGLHGIHMLV